jgi:hypothetical protein
MTRVGKVLGPINMNQYKDLQHRIVNVKVMIEKVGGKLMCEWVDRWVAK